MKFLKTQRYFTWYLSIAKEETYWTELLKQNIWKKLQQLLFYSSCCQWFASCIDKASSTNPWELNPFCSKTHIILIKSKWWTLEMHFANNTKSNFSNTLNTRLQKCYVESSSLLVRISGRVVLFYTACSAATFLSLGKFTISNCKSYTEK